MNRYPENLHNCRGYTILEALLALVIVSILAFPVYRLLTAEKKITVKTADKFAAYLIAGNEMEMLKSLDNLASEMLDKEFETGMNGKTYQVSVTIKRRFDQYGIGLDEIGEGLREVEVKVMYKERKRASLRSLFGGIHAGKRGGLEK